MKLNSNDPLTAKQLQIRVLLFFVGYICCLEFGNILTLSAEGFASFWPASGLFLAILLLTAKRYWLLLILTVFPAHILNGIFHQQSTVASLVHAVGGSLEAAVGAYMLRRLFSRKVQLTSSVLSMLWVIAAFVFAASINATLYTIIGTQSSNSFIEVWLQKLASDIVGMISVTPLIVAWSKPSKGLVKKQGYAALAELIILSVLSFATWFVIFSGIGGKAISQKYIAICFLFIAALRLTPKMFTFFGFVFAILAFYFGQTSASYEAWDVILIENRVVSIQIFVILSLLLSNQFRFLEQQRQSLLALESESESERKFAVVFQQAPLLMALSQIEDGSLLDVNNRFCEALGYTREELLNKTATEIGIISSEDRDRLAVEYSNLGRVSAVECKITRKNRTTIDCLVTAEEIRIGGVPRLLTIADDITDQKRTELELRRHSENLTLLIQASQSINQTLQLNEIYNAVHAFVQSILKFDAFVLSTFNPDTEKIRCVAAWSDGKQKSVSSVPEIPLAPEGTGIVSKVIRSGRAQLIKDYDKQFKDTKVKYIIAPDSDKVSTSSEGTQPAQTAIIVPIKNDDGVSGVIQVLSTEPNAYTQSQMNLIEAFALQVGLAIKNAQLYQASQNEIALRTWVESELRSSEERFRSMAEQLVDMLYQTDEKGVITYVSPSSLRIFGWLPEEMINHQFTEFLAEDQIPIATQAFQCAISTGKSASKLELLMRRKDGTVFQGELNAAMLFLDRKIVGTQGLIRDVTERKQVEEELWESKERYRAISEYSHNAICIIDEFAKILWVNDEMVKVGGYSREEIQHASSFADFVAPESLEFVVTNFQKVFRDEPYEHHYTFTIIRKDGVKRLCEKHMVDIKDNKGKRVLVISMLDVTEQKHAEVALKEVTQRLRLATVSSRMGVWDWNIPTGELIWDDRMYEIYGVDRSTFTCNFAEIVKLVHPEDIEQQYRASEDVKAGRREYDTEFRIVLNDGSIKYIKANAVIILDNDNKPWRMVGVNRDITELKLAEIELRERERKWATLISNLPGFVYRCANDPNWTMDYISIGCREVTGYEPEDFFNNRKLSYNDIVDPQYQEPLWNKWQQVLSRRESFEGEYQIITANGETRWVWERGQGIFDENGNLLWLEGFITDITERKRAETALIESEAQFRRIVETANEGIWVMDRSCKTTFVNSRMLEMLGCSMEILMENPIDFFMFKEDIEEHAEMMESREAGTSSIYEHRFKRSDGTTLWTIVSAAPIVSATGEYVGSFGMFTDITERKKT
ncbi:MAG: PAS domain S-box protein, partial [bacterium]|nr:PAS domain S-box protein [bacterium]